MQLNAEQSAWLARTQREWFDLFRPASTPLGRHIFDVGPKVPAEAVRKARVFGSRFDALSILPKGAIVAEVGTQAGLFAERILADTSPATLHLFDLEWDTLRGSRSTVADDHRVRLHLGDSSTELSHFPDSSFDWIYIDGDHSLDGVRKDTVAAVQKVKRDGILVFNDYTVWSIMELADYGVVPVVNGLLANGDWEMIYLALHPLMYCDVGLRRVNDSQIPL